MTATSVSPSRRSSLKAGMTIDSESLSISDRRARRPASELQATYGPGRSRTVFRNDTIGGDSSGAPAAEDAPRRRSRYSRQVTSLMRIGRGEAGSCR